jgi:hypothetical protein
MGDTIKAQIHGRSDREFLASKNDALLTMACYFLLKFIADKLITFTYDGVILLCMSTSSSDSTLYKCEVCSKTFNSQQEIERHNKEKHVETAGQKE